MCRRSPTATRTARAVTGSTRCSRLPARSPGQRGCAMWRCCACCTIWACAAARRCGSTSRRATRRGTRGCHPGGGGRRDCGVVSLPGNRILILGRGRSQKKEPVTLPEPTRAALAAWLEACGSEPGPLFVNFDRARKGHRLTGTAVYHIVGRLGAKAGLSVRPQELRHLAITTALERTDGDVRAVAEFSCHQDLRPLGRYRDNRQDLAGKVSRLVAEE